MKHIKLWIVILVLLTASLACVGAGPSDQGLPTVSFSTATPGGRISISLLTPTITIPASRSDATLIGPVATQTAAYGTAVAQTATAAVPSPTIAGILTTPALCPIPDEDAPNPTLPTTAPAFNRYAEIMVQYLSQGGPPTILEATLRAWGALTDFGGLVRADRDFTADGVPDVLVVVFDPDLLDESTIPGEMYIFGCQDRAYRLLYQSGYARDQSAPLIHSADDITGDYVNDLVYSTETCATNICNRKVFAVAWNLTLGSFENLFAEEVVEPFAEVVVSDVDEDGQIDISVTSGVINDPGAGPQRPVTTIYRFDGQAFVVGDIIPSPVEYRIHLIHDGDQALLLGDYDQALEAYRRARDDDLLLSWNYPNEAAYLLAFARYRIMLTQVRRGDISAAQAAHDQLLDEYLAPTPTPNPDQGDDQAPAATPVLGGIKPGIEFARMADFFWTDFALNRNVAQACDIVLGYARATPSALDVLNSFGYANLTYRAEDLCPFGADNSP